MKNFKNKTLNNRNFSAVKQSNSHDAFSMYNLGGILFSQHEGYNNKEASNQELYGQGLPYLLVVESILFYLSVYILVHFLD